MSILILISTSILILLNCIPKIQDISNKNFLDIYTICNMLTNTSLQLIIIFKFQFYLFLTSLQKYSVTPKNTSDVLEEIIIIKLDDIRIIKLDEINYVLHFEDTINVFEKINYLFTYWKQIIYLFKVLVFSSVKHNLSSSVS